MSAREVIARACTPTPDECFHGSGSIAPGASEFHCLVKMWEREIPRADAIISDLRAAGYVILSPDEVRGMRDEALDEAIKAALDHPGQQFTNHRGQVDWTPSSKYDVAAAIRSLKGGRDAQ